MYNVEGLTITKESTDWIVSDGERSFKIDVTTLEVEQSWFCSYEAIKRILSILDADKQLADG